MTVTVRLDLTGQEADRYQDWNECAAILNGYPFMGDIAMTAHPHESDEAVRYYSPRITLLATVVGFACVVGALAWAGASGLWPVLLAMVGGAFLALAMGRATLGEMERRRW